MVIVPKMSKTAISLILTIVMKFNNKTPIKIKKVFEQKYYLNILKSYLRSFKEASMLSTILSLNLITGCFRILRCKKCSVRTSQVL